MTLVDSVIILLVVVQLSVNLSISPQPDPFLVDRFKSDYLHTQVTAMAFFQTVELPQNWGLNVHMNANGNINKPVRLNLGLNALTIRLGTGRFENAWSSDD